MSDGMLCLPSILSAKCVILKRPWRFFCGWRYSNYYCPSIFRKAISKFTVCMHMGPPFVWSCAVCVRVCRARVALLKACCLRVQQAAHTLLMLRGGMEHHGCPCSPLPYLRALQ